MWTPNHRIESRSKGSDASVKRLPVTNLSRIFDVWFDHFRCPILHCGVWYLKNLISEPQSPATSLKTFIGNLLRWRWKGRAMARPNWWEGVWMSLANLSCPEVCIAVFERTAPHRRNMECSLLNAPFEYLDTVSLDAKTIQTIRGFRIFGVHCVGPFSRSWPWKKWRTQLGLVGCWEGASVEWKGSRKKET